MRMAAFCSPVRQRGMATLIVALLLLGIVSALTLVSLSYGMQGRRASAEDAAARLAQEAAQAGLDQGLQYFRARAGNAVTSWLAPGSAMHWERCAAQDTRVPCGTVAESVRGNYLRLPTALDMRDVFTATDGAPAPQLITRIGGFEVAYEVHALLCLVDTARPERQCISQTDAGAPEQARGGLIGPYAITLIAYSTLRAGGDSASVKHALAKETIALPAREGAAAMLVVVPGSWSDAGRIDARGNFAEN